MADNLDYVIKKIASTALQRFKNQNMLLKEYGEEGLRLYKAIDGEKTGEILIKEIKLTKGKFEEIMKFMEEKGMAEVKEKKKTKTLENMEQEEPELIKEEEIEEPEVVEQEGEETEPEQEKEEEIEFEKPEQDFIEPIEEESEIEEEEPITFDENEEQEEEPEVVEEEEEEIEPYSDEEIEPYSEEKEEPKTEDSSMENIIREKYGEKGIRVYKLIDGERSAEEIMKDTGLTESKLVEILDFMEEKGIIKLEYPDKKNKTAAKKEKLDKEELEQGFSPLTDKEILLTSIPKGMSSIDVPVKLPLDIVKSVQLKAKIMFEFGERGSKIFESINGKRDLVEIVIETKSSLQFVTRVINFLSESNAILLKPLNRNDIQKKYGVEAYRIYKKFGREGVLLYELIGKEMSIKEMMQKITDDKELFIEMFIFVHNVLGVPIPVERDILMKRLE